MKIYLAGSCALEHRSNMVMLADALKKKYDVYCPFELKIPNAWDMSQEEWAEKVFEKDVAALKECDFVIYLSPGRVSTAGSNWEQGFAYALGKKIFVFQYCLNATSLMTYCGCDYFENIALPDDINKIIEAIDKQKDKPKCSTVLT